LKSCIADKDDDLFLSQEEVLAENIYLSTPLILPRGYSLFIVSNDFGNYFIEHNKYA